MNPTSHLNKIATAVIWNIRKKSGPRKLASITHFELIRFHEIRRYTDMRDLASRSHEVVPCHKSLIVLTCFSSLRRYSPGYTMDTV